MLRLVELTGIEPLTSAVRLLAPQDGMAENRDFSAPILAGIELNSHACDTSAIPRTRLSPHLHVMSAFDPERTLAEWRSYACDLMPVRVFIPLETVQAGGGDCPAPS